ncbi:MAG: ABC transporter permease, partial [Chloroflexi bacterium]|nr:ABC transporter permease [Chloroflexota bacterium]
MTAEAGKHRGIPWRKWVAAVFTALAIGAVVIWASGASVPKAYQGLFEGALGSPRGIAETLVIATPYTLAGLAVALGFRCGLFNIGAEGQFYLGALFAVWVGYSVKGLPIFVHLPLAILVGALGGALWGAIPGFLKARLGTHEVINTIMMNYIAVLMVDWLVNRKGPMWDSTSTVPRTPYILSTATLPQLVPPYRLHAGLLIAIAAVFVVYWLLWKTTLGFEIRAVGANPSAAKYAGMSVTRNFVLAMTFSGVLAGLAGAGEVLGLNRTLPAAFVSGYGFDSIAIALLAKSHPLFGRRDHSLALPHWKERGDQRGGLHPGLGEIGMRLTRPKVLGITFLVLGILLVLYGAARIDPAQRTTLGVGTLGTRDVPTQASLVLIGLITSLGGILALFERLRRALALTLV